MLYNSNQDRSVNHRQDMEQLRKELKRWEGEGKAKKVDIGDTDEYQVRVRAGMSTIGVTHRPRAATPQGRICRAHRESEAK